MVNWCFRGSPIERSLHSTRISRRSSEGCFRKAFYHRERTWGLWNSEWKYCLRTRKRISMPRVFARPSSRVRRQATTVPQAPRKILPRTQAFDRALRLVKPGTGSLSQESWPLRLFWLKLESFFIRGDACHSCIIQHRIQLPFLRAGPSYSPISAFCSAQTLHFFLLHRLLDLEVR